MSTKRQGKLYKKTINREEPDPIDVYVGERMRRARSLCNMSQQEFGKRMYTRNRYRNTKPVITEYLLVDW